MTDESIVNELCEICSAESVAVRLIDRIAYSRDASGYRIIPRAIVRPKSLDQIRALFSWGILKKIPLTFRASGTSLSGQAVGEGVVVEISRKWKQYEILDSGKRFRSQPGLIAGRANIYLKPYGRKLGPDPASINSCSIGGILANNSSGMCCGVLENSYNTVESLAFLLPDGLYINTSEKNANELLLKNNKTLYEGILSLKSEIRKQSSLCEVIRRKYRIKNTMGYSLNAFLDEDNPAEILAKLMIGSEGTLGFISEAVFLTIPEKQCKSVVILYFADVASACSSIIPLRDAGAAAIELMDRAALRSVEHLSGAPAILRSLPESACALLVEFQAASNDELNNLESQGKATLGSLDLLIAASFTRDAKEQADLWKIRKGMFTAVGASRDSGTGIINEDVAFPVERLAEAVTDLQNLFRRHNYKQAIIFGHAKDGNLHFVLTQKFDTPNDIARYDELMQEVAILVIDKYQGSFKAEHGAGRNAAPFVEKEWGGALYDVMRRLKQLIDPNNILNPGIILNDDPKAHIRNIKQYTIVEDVVDKCIECGYCESHCPSKDLTLTPRQRIAVRREIVAARQSGDFAIANELENEYAYDGLDTCATDSMCSLACPVDIDTGDLVKLLREQRHTKKAKFTAEFVSKNFKSALRAAQAGLFVGRHAANIVGDGAIIALTKRIGRLTGSAFPQWNKFLTKSPKLKLADNENASAVYFPSCINRVLGGTETGDLQDVFMTLCARAGLKVYAPRNVNAFCCGMPFSSKGYAEAAEIMQKKTIAAINEWTDGGRLPIIADANSCSLTLKSLALGGKFQVFDAVEFASEYLIPELKLKKLAQTVAIHITCSALKSGVAPCFEKIAQLCAEKVVVPLSNSCCGFAGDRGLLMPELTQSATREEAAEINQNKCSRGYSGNITCEIAMSAATGLQYRSILYLLEEASRQQ